MRNIVSSVLWYMDLGSKQRLLNRLEVLCLLWLESETGVVA